MYTFSPPTGEWTLIDPANGAPPGRYDMGFALAGEQLYVYGGFRPEIGGQ